MGVDKGILIPTSSLTESPCPQVSKQTIGKLFPIASKTTCGVPSATLVKKNRSLSCMIFCTSSCDTAPYHLCAADLAVSANIPESYVPSQEQRMDLYRRIALVRSEAEADDLMDEVIDRFGDPPPSVYTLVQVALLRSDAGKVGVTDISQKNGCLKFLLAQFDMQKVSLLYARPEFKGRLKVDAGAKPGVILRLKSRDHVIEQARAFVSAWADAREERA